MTLLEKMGAGLVFFSFSSSFLRGNQMNRMDGWMDRMPTCASAGNGVLPYPTAK